MQTSDSRHQSGFTLIELMIVIAIIGILASLAVSTYQTYTVRAQVAEALNFAANTKVVVVDSFNNTGVPPATRADAGLTAAATDTRGTYVSQVNIVDGRVDVTFGNTVHADIFGNVLSFTPYLLPSGGVIWRCGAEPAPGGGAVLLTDGGGNTSSYIASTLPERYMPANCRQ